MPLPELNTNTAISYPICNYLNEASISASLRILYVAFNFRRFFHLVTSNLYYKTVRIKERKMFTETLGF